MISSRSFYFILIALWCWLFSTMAVAAIPTQHIDRNFTKLEHFQIGYFVDHSEEMSFNEIKRQRFTQSKNAVSLGAEAQTTWAKVELENASNTSLNLYLHNPYAYHSHAFELYEVVDGKLSRKRLLDLNDKKTQQWMYRGVAVFDISLLAKQHKTLFIKSYSFSYQWFSFELYNADQSKRVLMSQYMDTAVVAGMLLALTIYNFLLFFSSRLKEHLFYACYLIFGGFWISFSYGLWANWFNVFGITTLKWHLSLGAMPIFLLMFMINIFDTKKKYPIEHKALLLTIAILAIDSIYGLFDIVTALKYSSTLAAVMMIISLSVTISMIIRKQPIALLFLLGHGLFVFFSSLSVLFYKGKIEFTYISSHGVGIGILLESLVLSLIIANRIRTLEKLKVAQAELQLLASTDPLTQLLNRRSFGLEASALLDQDKQIRFPLSLAILDIDLFKNINDTYGHGLGDQVIVRVADVLRQQCRHQDIVARYGGEEFVILMPNTSREKAHVLAERIRKALEKATIQVDQHQLVNFTLSVGIAEVDPKTANLQAAIDQADTALYKAKNSGRNQSQLYMG